MRTFILLLFFISVFFQAEAQKMYATVDSRAGRPEEITATRSDFSYRWEIYSSLKNYTDHSCSRTDELRFGREVACLLALLDERYIRKEQVAAGDPALNTSIIQPVVYNSVKGIEKYYFHKYRLNNYTDKDKEAFTHVLKVAIACADEEIADFGKILKSNRKNAEVQVGTFLQVKLKNIYE